MIPTRLRPVLVSGCVLMGCGSEATPAAEPGPAGDPTEEVSPTPDLVAPDLVAPDLPPEEPDTVDVWEVIAPMLPEELPAGLPSTDLLGDVGDRRPARTIIHAHTVYSHDACDGQPVLKDGSLNEACLQSFRDALCTDHIDAVMLTEHSNRMAEALDFEQLFLRRPGDEWVEEGGIRVANTVVCEDGHRALILPGIEGSGGSVSPLGMTSHPAEGSVEAIKAAYADGSPAGVANLRAHGGIPVVLHLEDAESSWLHEVDIDAVEIGNLHVLVAPNYREQLGLDPSAPISAFANWMLLPEEHPPADLVFLEFHERLTPYHDWWDALLAERMITGFAGNDVHQNVLPAEMGDEDRPDSYRRMMKWYVNYLMVGERTPAQIREALQAARVLMVFEILGSPQEFDFRAEAGADVWRPGDQVPAAARAGLRLRAPVPAALVGGVTLQPDVSMRLIRVSAAGAEVVADVQGALDVTVDQPGRYRLEVFATPAHLGPYLEGHERLIRELPWLYTNPIEVQ